MFRLSHWRLIITPKAALQILGIVPSSSTAPHVAVYAASVNGEKDHQFFSPHSWGSCSASESSTLSSASTSTFISSRILEQLTPAKIKKAYIARTLLCHPDLFPDDPSANEKFKQLGEALRVALQVLKEHTPGERGSDSGLPNSEKRAESIHDAIASLCRCMISYHQHEKREKRRRKCFSKMTVSESGSSQGYRTMQKSHLPSKKENAEVWSKEMKKKMSEEEVEQEDPYFVNSVFETPSLEKIRDVCQKEHAALEKTQELCAGLPALLSGERTALFDATAFFYTRYVFQTLSCVSRFVHHLPILVRRVVVQRKQKFRQHVYQKRRQSPLSKGTSTNSNNNTRIMGPTEPGEEVSWPAFSHTKEANVKSSRVVFGFGTGNRPHKQAKIEDMAMKPLVLMGVLLFDIADGPMTSTQKEVGGKNGKEERIGEQEKETRRKDGASFKVEAEQSIGEGKAEAMPEEEEEKADQSSTCPGVHYPSDIKVCPELQCCVYPTDTVEMIVDKLAKWEQRSFDRLQVELSMADVTALLSDLMGLVLDGSTSSSSRPSSSLIVVRPNLEASLDDAVEILRMVQNIAKEVCARQDTALDYVFPDDVVMENLLRTTGKDEKEKVEEEIVDKDEPERERPRRYATSSFQTSTLPHRNPFTEKHQYVEKAQSSWWWKRAVSLKKVTPPSSAKKGAGTAPFVNEARRNVASSTHCCSSFFSTIDVSPFIPSLIALCRTVSRLSSAYVHGNIVLTWPNDRLSSSSRSAETMAATERSSDTQATEQGSQIGKEEEKVNVDERQKKINMEMNVGEKVETSRNASEEERSSKESTRSKGRPVARLYSPFRIARHPMSCIAEDISFVVTIELVPDIFLFLSRWVAALTTIIQQGERSHQILPALLSLREKVVREEFIPKQCLHTTKPSHSEEVDTVNQGESSALEKIQTEGQKGFSSTSEGSRKSESLTGKCKEEKTLKDEEEVMEYDYRSPLWMFPRLFNMHTWQEKLFWERVYEHRVYLARYAPMISPFQVFLDCLPYDPSTFTPIPEDNGQFIFSSNPAEDRVGQESVSPTIPAGWVGHHDSDGSDQVIVTNALLHSSADFRLWLEDVVEQSSLQKEVERVLAESNISYLKREPSLPLTYFLSFLQVFRQASAVRSVFEAHASNSDIGWSIVVGTRCEIREGKLHIPWHMDPSVLIGLLQGSSFASLYNIGHDNNMKNSMSFLTAT